MHTSEITDILDPALDLYARKNESQLLHYNEPGQGYLIAESPKVVRRALNAGCKPVSFLASKDVKSREEQDLIQEFADSEVVLYEAPESVLKQLTGYELNRGIWSVMLRPGLPSVEEVLASASRVVILENIENPTNIGAIIRSAAALHIDAILLTPGCADPYYRRAARVSMGTCFQIPWTYLPSQEVGEYKLVRNLGFKTVAMALTPGSVAIDDSGLKKEEKLAIILGNEGDGLSRATIENADYTVRIPMSHDVDSLNVAAAGAVVFWELTKK